MLAETGVMAAISAGKGVTGALDVLEGVAGMGAAMSKAADCQRPPPILVRSITLRRLPSKSWLLRPHFAALTGFAAMATHGFGADDIASITIATYGPAVAITDRMDPKTRKNANSRCNMWSPMRPVLAALGL